MAANTDGANPTLEAANASPRSSNFAKILRRCVCGYHVVFFRCPPRVPKEMPYVSRAAKVVLSTNSTTPVTQEEEMKRSASASFDRETIKEPEVEPTKKITKSVQTKKSTAKPHDDIDELPSPIRVKKDVISAPKPLEPLAVNDAPTEKELAAAKAARIRLGYEKQDTAMTHSTQGEILLKVPVGPEPVAVEVEYIPTDELKSLDNLDEVVQGITCQLGTKDWEEMCTALNTVRQLTVHHTAECLPLLPTLVPAVLKLFKNPRSSVCKTSALCFGDLLRSLKDEMFPHLDVGGLSKPASSVLNQLLLKSCTDKQFVAEEVQKVLTVISQELDVIRLTALLTPYASEHKNQKVRGKAGTVLASVTERMSAVEWKEIGLVPLLKVAAVLITDRTPDAREAARLMIVRIQSMFYQHKASSIEGTVDGAVSVNISVVDNNDSDAKPLEEEPYLSDSSDEDETKPTPSSPWKLFCEEHLTMTQAIAVVKVQSK